MCVSKTTRWGAATASEGSWSDFFPPKIKTFKLAVSADYGMFFFPPQMPSRGLIGLRHPWNAETHPIEFSVFDLPAESSALVRSLLMSPRVLWLLIPNCVKWTPSEEMTPCDSLWLPCSRDVTLLLSAQYFFLNIFLPKIFFILSDC